MSTEEEALRLRGEARRLRQQVGVLEEALRRQREQCEKLKKRVVEQAKEIQDLLKANEQLKEGMEKLRRAKEGYRRIIFKGAGRSVEPEGDKRKRGGQVGHRGHGRTNPVEVDRTVRVYAERCQDCHGELVRSDRFVSHTVVDIPEVIRPVITQYEKEQQWCPRCRKEVIANPTGVISGSRLGVNVMVEVLLWRYECRLPFHLITKVLKVRYGVDVSAGGLVEMLHRVREWFGKPYDEILVAVRAASVKHGDETGWRVGGRTSWVWGFFTQKEAYYTIEESRGKGVAEKVLLGSGEKDLLVRDDYAAYQKLPLEQQSCWSHLLRKSHEEASEPNASYEVKQLHEELQGIFVALSEIIRHPFEVRERTACYEIFAKQLEEIAERSYEADDVKRIQGRIQHQGNRLISALLVEGAPLTNNLAERSLRPMVVTRKISGGSQSEEGAQTHAVNMSVIQTLCFRGEPLAPSLKLLLLQHATGQATAAKIG